MLQLIQFFLSQQWEVFFGTTASKNDNSIDLTSLGVQEFSIELNSTSFDEQIQQINPSIVLFDRFMMEEQFGWRVTENCPNTLRILDTEDLHSLRKTRQEALKKGVEFSADRLLDAEIAKREIAAIYRCDLSLIISTYEMILLQERFQMDASMLCHLPFLLEPISEATQASWKPFEERSDFVSIGNFLHAPNLDATIQLKKVIWPKIRKQLPKAALHIYGAYPSQQVLEFHHPKEGFFVHGFVEDANEVIENAKVLLAPLRFGAGIKGKLTDAMLCGTPSITTDIGAEGMHGTLPWNGFVETDVDAFVSKAIELYSDQQTWLQAQQNGVAIIHQQYNRSEEEAKLLARIQYQYEHLASLRRQNFIGQLLQHHTMNSYKYLSKWIEAKNRN
jgi:glycosyltransferase involved in cell wall biosynthesis